MAEHNEHQSSSKYQGLSSEVGTILRDPQFQSTVKQFRQNVTFFRVVKGIGFVLALGSGLFGYFLKANSEADDRKAIALTAVINEKKEWLRRVNDAHFELRKTLLLMKLECGKNDHNKALKNAHEEARIKARYAYFRAVGGSAEVFNIETSNMLRNIIIIEQKIADICSEKTDFIEDMVKVSREANQLMRSSIDVDRKKLEELGTGLWDGPRTRF